MTRPEIDKGRLWDSLQRHGAIGATELGGINREALTEADRLGRDLFVDWCRQAGMEIGVDRLGNVYATRPGQDDSLEPIAIGSHLDTQPTGGRYDGILGVLGGLEVVRALNDARWTTRRPVTVVNWTNEEGSRFVPSMLASGVYAHVFPMDSVREVKDGDGVFFLDALRSIGYDGPEDVGARRFRAYFELHIEQGPVLEANGIEIGVVTGSQAMSWSKVTVRGRAAHAGTTPMPNRLDALSSATRMLSRCFELAHSTVGACATVGVMEALPGSHSTVPHTVKFTLDLRHPDEAMLEAMLTDFERSMSAEDDKGFDVTRELFGAAAAQAFDERCVATVREAARAGGYSHCDIISGAGHDAVYVNQVCPSGMIFVPCAGGISHNPSESITPEQAAAGVDVLLRSILAMADARG